MRKVTNWFKEEELEKFSLKVMLKHAVWLNRTKPNARAGNEFGRIET